MASFGQAFATARKAGKSEFTWNGKRYNTKRADDPKETPKKAPVPTAKPKAEAKKGKSVFSGVDSDSLAPKKKAPVPATGRDRFGPKKEAPKEESFRDKFKRTVGAPTRAKMKMDIKY